MKILFKCLCVFLCLLMSAVCAYPESGVKREKYVYYIYGVSKDNGGYHFFSYNTSKSDKDKHKVKIAIRTSDSIRLQNKPVYFLSLNGDSKCFFTDVEGSIDIPLVMLFEYPKMVIDKIDTICDDRRYTYYKTELYFNQLSVGNGYGSEYYIDAITVTLKKMTPETAFYKIESDIPLGNSEIEQIKKDIITGNETNELWRRIVVTSYVEI